MKCNQCKIELVKMDFSLSALSDSSSVPNIDVYFCTNCGRIELFSTELLEQYNNALSELNDMENRIPDLYSDLYKKLESSKRRDKIFNFTDTIREITKKLHGYKSIIQRSELEQKLPQLRVGLWEEINNEPKWVKESMEEIEELERKFDDKKKKFEIYFNTVYNSSI